MKQTNRRCMIAAGLTVALLGLGQATAQDASVAASKLAQCHALPDGASRLLCYDSLAVKAPATAVSAAYAPMELGRFRSDMPRLQGVRVELRGRIMPGPGFVALQSVPEDRYSVFVETLDLTTASRANIFRACSAAGCDAVVRGMVRPSLSQPSIFLADEILLSQSDWGPKTLGALPPVAGP